MQIKLDGLSVAVGIPAGRDFHALTVRSLIETFGKCQAMGIPAQLALVAGNAVIQWARDEVIDLFLKTDCSRLFWIDSDIVWDPNDFIRMLALSQKRDIVCATYPAKKEPTTFYINHDPPLVSDDLGLFEIKGAGLGFTVVTRRVIEDLVSFSPKAVDQITGKNIAQVFRVGMKDGTRIGEDMAFFDDVRKLGFKVHLDPLVKLRHLGLKQYEGSIFDAIQTDKESCNGTP
jgi:hypothetical protein